MHRIRTNPAPRASSPADPDEFTITEDGYRFEVGDRLFNYYDGKWGVVGEIDAQGWFTFFQDDGSSATLNSVRVAGRRPT